VIETHVAILSETMKHATYDSWLYLSSTRIYQGLENLATGSSRIRVMPGADGIYDISKLLGESLRLTLDRSNVRVVRLSNVYGIGQGHHTFLGALISDIYAKIIY
jgi:nucleoside-diphosphate-sugar epimerase